MEEDIKEMNKFTDYMRILLADIVKDVSQFKEVLKEHGIIFGYIFFLNLYLDWASQSLYDAIEETINELLMFNILKGLYIVVPFVYFIVRGIYKISPNTSRDYKLILKIITYSQTILIFQIYGLISLMVSTYLSGNLDTPFQDICLLFLGLMLLWTLISTLHSAIRNYAEHEITCIVMFALLVAFMWQLYSYSN